MWSAKSQGERTQSTNHPSISSRGEMPSRSLQMDAGGMDTKQTACILAALQRRDGRQACHWSVPDASLINHIAQHAHPRAGIRRMPQADMHAAWVGKAGPRTPSTGHAHLNHAPRQTCSQAPAATMTGMRPCRQAQRLPCTRHKPSRGDSHAGLLAGWQHYHAVSALP
jgi:hypothetical protein